MQTWRIFDDLKPHSKVDYINACCEFGDTVLEKIKPTLAERIGVALDRIVVGQEDWGWYLEFQKESVVYILSISHQERDADDDGGAYNFGVTIEAQKIMKGLIFNRRIDAEKECREFTEVVEAVAKQNHFIVTEE